MSLAKQSKLDWRSAVLSAVENVQTSQSNLAYYRKQAHALQDAANAYQRSLALAQEIYRGGALTLLDLLDTDRSTVSARMGEASSQNDLVQEWVTLQIALGRGLDYDSSSLQLFRLRVAADLLNRNLQKIPINFSILREMGRPVSLLLL